MGLTLDQQLDVNGYARVLVLLRRGADKEGIEKYFFFSMRREGIPEGARAEEAKVSDFPMLRLLSGPVDRQGLHQLRSDPRVEEVIGPLTFRLLLPVSTTSEGPTEPRRRLLRERATPMDWGLEELEIDTVWSREFTGAGITVGHLDTGLDGEHPALSGAIDGPCVNVDDQGCISPVSSVDFVGHGTHTAGTIAGREVQHENIVGVAPGAKLASAIIVNGAEDVVAGAEYPIERLVGGIHWAMGRRVQIINLSVGIEGAADDLAAFAKVIREVQAAGILLVCAAGNFGPNTSVAPGNYRDAFAVGACNSSFTLWSPSCSADLPRDADPRVPDLIAPGQSVNSAWSHNASNPRRWHVQSGTSMSTAYISGLAALLMQAAQEAPRSLTAADVQEAIFLSCCLGALSPERANRGIPHPLKALSILRPDLSIRPGRHPACP